MDGGIATSQSHGTALNEQNLGMVTTPSSAALKPLFFPQWWKMILTSTSADLMESHDPVFRMILTLLRSPTLIIAPAKKMNEAT